MSGHVLCCIDATVAGADDTTVVSGWCLCTDRIVTLAVEVDGQAHVADYGSPRPDVVEAFPGYPNADACGFSLAVPGAPRELCIRVTVDGAQHHLVTVFLEPGRAQRVDVGERESFARGVPRDVEQALLDSLEHTPGITLRIDLVNKCNLRCVMCHYSDPEVRRRPRREISLDQLTVLLEEVGPDLRQVMLSCADEPLINPQFTDVLHHLAEHYPHVDTSFCTNGMLLDDRIIRCLVAAGVSRITASLDGIRAATVEGIRTGADFARIVGNLVALRDLKAAAGTSFPILTLDFVMMACNLEEAPDYVEFAHLLGARAIDFRLVIPSRYLSDPAALPGADPALFNAVRERVVRQARRFGIDVMVPPAMDTGTRSQGAALKPVDWSETRELLRPAPSTEVAPPPTPGRPRGYSPRVAPGAAELVFADTFCPRPFSEITIADQELVKPCPFYRSHLGRLDDDLTLREHFLGPAFQELRRAMLRPEGDAGCLGCPIRERQLPTTRHRHGLLDRRRWRPFVNALTRLLGRASR